MICEECKTSMRKDKETGGHWCPVCSFNNARRRQLAAEARATELAAQLATAQAALEQVTKERNDMRAVLDYWLTYGRFIPRDYSPDSEHSKAVKALALGVLPAELVIEVEP